MHLDPFIDAWRALSQAFGPREAVVVACIIGGAGYLMVQVTKVFLPRWARRMDDRTRANTLAVGALEKRLTECEIHRQHLAAVIRTLRRDVAASNKRCDARIDAILKRLG